MKYSEKLRMFADYLEDHPEVDAKMDGPYDYPSVYISVDEFEDFQELIKHMGGFQKGGYGGTIQASHELRGIFAVTAAVSGACEATPKLDEDGNPVTRKIPAVEAQPEKEVAVMTYNCPTAWLAD